MINKLYDYINDIKSGKLKVGLEIRQAVKRFEDDLTRSDVYFDIQKAEKAILFISCLKHFTGKHDNKPFILEPWQVFIIANLYGLFLSSNKRRKYSLLRRLTIKL
jgi:phage terminase large subunit-like protein